MRGSTVKKINQFVAKLIAETPPEQVNKTHAQMVAEVKRMWTTEKKAQEFVRKVLAGDFNEQIKN
jgi:hypothetical protein